MSESQVIESFNQEDIDEWSEYWDGIGRPIVRDFLNHVMALRPIFNGTNEKLMRKSVNAFKDFINIHERKYGDSLIFEIEENERNIITRLVLFFLEKSGYHGKCAYKLYEEYNFLTIEEPQEYDLEIPNTHSFQLKNNL